MKDRFSPKPYTNCVSGNIFADKSSIILDWILRIGINRDYFSLREVADAGKISVGLTGRVFKILTFHGFLKTTGVQTAKRFTLCKPKALLNSWVKHYNILNKCKLHTYCSGFQSRDEIIKALESSGLQSKTTLALHSAAKAHGCNNTNLQTVELFLLEPNIKTRLEEILDLESQEKGYEVLLIQPYYKSLLKRDTNLYGASSPLLTFLDLYHFPLRGLEQAEFMAERIAELKQVFSQKQ